MIKLHVPTQEIELGQLTPKPEQLLKWVNKRQLGSVCKHAKKILLLLKTYNRCQTTSVERYEFIKSLTPVVEDALTTLVNSSQKLNTAVAKGEQSISEMVIQFYEELAITYKVLLVDSMANNRIKKDKELISELIFGAIYFLSKQLLVSYHYYKVEPSGVWGETHRLYQYAEQHKLLYKVHTYNSIESSISRIYKIISLVSMGNPYSLMPGEALKVSARLETMIESIMVTPLKKFNGDSQKYFTDLDSEKGPDFSLPQHNSFTNRIRVFDIDSMVTEINLFIKSLQPTNNAPNISLLERMEREMLLRLTHAWKGRKERKHQRHSAISEVLLVSGLSPSHHFICGQKYFEPEYDEINLYRPIPTEESSFSLMPQEYEPWKANDIAGKIESGMLHPRFSKYCDELDIWKKTLATKSQARVKYDSKVKDYTAQLWQQVDNSTGGIGLRREFACDIHVGEIVSYKFDDANDEQEWKVGIVRWLKENEDRQYEVGIMNLPSVLKTTAVRAIDGAGKGSEYFRSLLLFDTANKIKSIVVPANIYDTGTRLIMNSQTGLTYVELEQVIHTTSSFSHFNFKEIPIPLSEKHKIRSLRNSDQLNTSSAQSVA